MMARDSGCCTLKRWNSGISHAKVYLLDGPQARRVIVGSANLSVTAFGGEQAETLQAFDDDDLAWETYERLYNRVRVSATDEVPIDPDQIAGADVRFQDLPVLSSVGDTKVIVGGGNEAMNGAGTIVFEPSAGTRIEAVERIKRSIPSAVTNLIPTRRKGVQTVGIEKKREIRRQFTRLKLVERDADETVRTFSIDRDNGTATLLGNDYTLTADPDGVRADAKNLVQYFRNFEAGFKVEDDVPRLQRDYFILWSWLYFSPFMCDLRSRADDLFLHPMFAVVYGKASCGKTSLIDTLMTSMFGQPFSYHKRHFTRSYVYNLQSRCKRFPAVFDDIGKNAFRDHGQEVIKDEHPTDALEQPPFVLSMNNDFGAFPDEIVKRCLMVYTTTALPAYDEDLRHRLAREISNVQENLTGELYREFLRRVVKADDQDFYGSDWLKFASGILTNILFEACDDIPDWCSVATWSDYAATRYDRVKEQLRHQLRSETEMEREGHRETGWFVEGEQIIVIDSTDSFGRRQFDWKNVPSTLINDEASIGKRVVLHRQDVESFIEQPVGKGRRTWLVRLMRRGRM